MSTTTASPPTDDGAWTFLEDTYWYVPTPYLPAIVLANVDPPQTAAVVDQTLWHIESVENGYVVGSVASNFGTGWSYATLVGSISPDGSVSFSFTPSDPDSDITVGIGSMVKVDGAWFFEMQMTTGSGSLNVTHWAEMAQVSEGDRAWDSLPGYPGTSVPEAFSGDAPADPPLTLYMGTNGNDILPPPGAPEGVLLFGLDGNDTLTGSSAVDGLDGGKGKDKLTAGGGADDLYGESGADVLKGGSGSDYLDGGKGKDKLTGGDDADLLHGGNGKDKFIVTDVAQSTPEAPDTILDFFAGKDRIDLKKIDARPDDKGDDAFRFIGKLDFTGREGELRYKYAKGNTIVEGDTDGDGMADLAIVLTGKIALGADDFVL
ncbi:MAG: M10 family metallopeptidase C-terminal domain-containing protein [Rhizobiales bacterium]|nr:M10 family metallopeptidase C-terminal domain-containing protein [Hyphomicrobiales bacterium]